MNDGTGHQAADRDADAALVERARVDHAAFAALYRRYLDRVYAYCVYRLGTREQAEDATSQVFLKALASLPDHRPGGSFRAWLFAIAHNVVTDAYRARRDLRPLVDATGYADAEPSPEDTAITRDETVRLLALLPAEQRRIMELRLAGLTGAEIAAVLGKNLGAVKMAQSRAMARIRAALEPAEPPTSSHEVTLHVRTRRRAE